MKLYFYGIIMLFKKFILKKNTGEVINSFVRKMGVVYIKLAQILAMQNVDGLFTEEDRKKLCNICDDCNPIPYKKIEKIIEKEYGCSIKKKFKKIYEEPIGSASISQVHKAILKNGNVVAIKVKRKDITKKIEHDVKQIRKFIHRFGGTVGFQNFLGSDYALELYLNWIYEEIDFEREKRNLIKFHEFAESVNGQIPDTSNIVTPKLYQKMCTDNIIVMEYIDSWTVNKMKLTQKNKEKISKALNDYLRLSFYSLFHYNKVTFHGDPHGGNIYIDRKGNIGFLDMGLVFSFEEEETEYIRNLFLTAYFNQYEKLTDILIKSSDCEEVDEEELAEGISECCKEFHNIPVTTFFINMVFVFTKHNVAPPEVLFKLAKAFIALNGLSDITKNRINTEELLIEQITEYYVNRTFTDVNETLRQGINLLPNLMKNIMEKGLIKGVSQEVIALNKLHSKVESTINNFEEILTYFK